MYVVLESGPSPQDRSADKAVISDYGSVGPQLLGLAYHCSRKRRVYRIHQDLHSIRLTCFLQYWVMLICRKRFLDGHQTQFCQRWDHSGDSGEDGV